MRCLFFLIAIVAAQAGNLRNNSRRAVAGQGVAKAPQRRARASASPPSPAPRKLAAEPQLPNLLPRGIIPAPINGLFNVPRDLLTNFVGAGNGVMTGATAGQVQKSIGDFVDRTRNVADSSFDTVEQLAQGVAQRSRSVLDRATSRAAGFVDHSVALGTNTLGAGIDAARGLREEAERAAHQAANVASGAVKASELAVAGAFDRFATAVNHNSPTHDTLLAAATPNGSGLQGLLSNPLGSIINLAAGSI